MTDTQETRGALTDKEISEQDARFSIDGAIALGRIGANPPPAGHWLAEYWSIGQQLAELGKTSAWDNQTPVDAPSLPAGDGLTDEVRRVLKACIGPLNIAATTTQMYPAAKSSAATMRQIEDALSGIQAILAAPRQPGEVGAGVPEGWKLVPVKPTGDMLDAMLAPWHDGSNRGERETLEAAYDGMLASVPSAQQDERAARKLKDASEWLLDVMGDWDFTIPNGAFDKIVSYIAAQQVQADAVFDDDLRAEYVRAIRRRNTDDDIRIAVMAIERRVKESIEGQQVLAGAVAWIREGAKDVLHNFRFDKPDEGPWVALYAHPSPAGESDKRGAPGDVVALSIIRCATAVVKHWNEFGPEADFERAMHRLDAALEARAAMSREQSGGQK